MAADGFVLTGLDGQVEQAGPWGALPAPFQFRGVRPDACGVRSGDGVIGFAEAKTHGDVDNAHTREQLSVLGFARMRDGRTRCPLYIAVPRSAAYALDRVLIDVGLIASRHVKRLHIPSVLLVR
jgi:hypothetical protein